MLDRLELIFQTTVLNGKKKEIKKKIVPSNLLYSLIRFSLFYNTENDVGIKNQFLRRTALRYRLYKQKC